ncbi:uncharacterized protein LOC131239943 [Magnolia sinica]|uniref:uncharacterized protein LOC131239943 n=1 Tax=Magnolia sinica TaxID=86752 RepID=UPI0026583C53|nr:uncharacterized protein LOC131239943 [Magnolia sinica]XP_058093884.1 uncharacterized protein LOC131239943 [Magnolia sinica]XP_058093888.1 uncharacterized protein LOC131239943 [Magnolia sinica]
MQDPDINLKRRKQIALNLAAAFAGGAYYMTYMGKKVRQTPAHSGATYVEEILQGHPTRFREVCRMELPAFKKLCDILRRKRLLQNTAGVNVEEQLAMFLFTVGHNASNRQVQKRFHHSGETVSRHFNNTLNALTHLSARYICLPPPNIPPEIHDQPDFFPYFKDCIGAIDGTCILSQNVMAACSFDSRFTYVLAGWEDSIEDSTVLEAALSTDFQVPEGKYYLVDADYGNSPGFISPYPGIRYHQKDFAHGQPGPRNEREIFNYRHSSLQNSIERAFSVLKKRFQILTAATSYPIDSQVKLVLAMCTLHNYIHTVAGGEDWLYVEYDSENQYPPAEEEDKEEEDELSETEAWEEPYAVRRAPADVLRDKIARDMWVDYCRDE